MNKDNSDLHALEPKDGGFAVSPGDGKRKPHRRDPVRNVRKPASVKPRPRK